MMYLAQNLKELRTGKGLTQEHISEVLGVSPQSISKWERGENYPDITLLPALANFFEVSVDLLIGMDKINDKKVMDGIYLSAHNLLRNNDVNAAVKINDIKQLPEPTLKVISDVVKEFLALKNNQEEVRQRNSRAAMFGCLRGQYKISNDFGAPLEDFKEYME